jgi:hypothetical protein
MDNVVENDVSSKNVSDEYKYELRNKIIAVGLNSLANAYGEADKALLNEFIMSDLGGVLPTWHLLGDKVRFEIFIIHIDSFRNYMEEQAKREGL